MKRILYIIDSFVQGGAERSTIELAKYIQSKGIEVDWFILKHKEGGFYTEVASYFSNVHFSSRRSFLGQLLEIIRLIREKKPDIVHSVLWSSNIRSRFAKIFCKGIFLESLVSIPYDAQRLKDPSVIKWKLEGYRIIDKVTSYFGVTKFHANSNHVAFHYHNKLNIANEKIEVIYRGRPDILDSDYHDKLFKSRLRNNHIVLINLGRNVYSKAQDVLISAFVRTKEYKSGKAKLLIAGNTGPITMALRELIAEYNAEEQIELLGHRDDVINLLLNSHIMVFPSRFEGLPGTLIEACAAGLPIITTDLPMMHEVVERDKNALMVPVDDVEELANAIDRLAADETLRRQFGARSCEIYLEKFQEENVHQQMLDFYQRVIAKTKGNLL